MSFLRECAAIRMFLRNRFLFLSIPLYKNSPDISNTYITLPVIRFTHVSETGYSVSSARENPRAHRYGAARGFLSGHSVYQSQNTYFFRRSNASTTLACGRARLTRMPYDNTFDYGNSRISFRHDKSPLYSFNLYKHHLLYS